MSTSDIIRAYESGLITEREAIEQGLVDDLDRLYEKSSRGSRFASANAEIGNRRFASH